MGVTASARKETDHCEAASAQLGCRLSTRLASRAYSAGASLLRSAFSFWSRPRARLFWPPTTLVQFRYQAPSTELQARKLGNCCNYAVSQARAPVLSSRATGFLAGADWLGWTIPNCPCATSFGGTSALELCQWWSRQPGIKDACESRGRRGANSRW